MRERTRVAASVLMRGAGGGLRLRRPPIGLGEYFDYGIWHRSVTPQLRDEFIGWRLHFCCKQQLFR